MAKVFLTVREKPSKEFHGQIYLQLKTSVPHVVCLNLQIGPITNPFSLSALGSPNVSFWFFSGPPLFGFVPVWIALPYNQPFVIIGPQASCWFGTGGGVTYPHCVGLKSSVLFRIKTKLSASIRRADPPDHSPVPDFQTSATTEVAYTPCLPLISRTA